MPRVRNTRHWRASKADTRNVLASADGGASRRIFGFRGLLIGGSGRNRRGVGACFRRAAFYSSKPRHGSAPQRRNARWPRSERFADGPRGWLFVQWLDGRPLWSNDRFRRRCRARPSISVRRSCLPGAVIVSSCSVRDGRGRAILASRPAWLSLVLGTLLALASMPAAAKERKPSRCTSIRVRGQSSRRSS